jgi:hypothetical protein
MLHAVWSGAPDGMEAERMPMPAFGERRPAFGGRRLRAAGGSRIFSGPPPQ